MSCYAAIVSPQAITTALGLCHCRDTASNARSRQTGKRCGQHQEISGRTNWMAPLRRA